MMASTLFGIPVQALFGQIFVGLINGSFYAMLSLGLAIIFGMLRIINFAHGVQYMLGALFSFLLLHYFQVNFWTALIVAPLATAVIGAVIERYFLSRLYDQDHLYGLLFTLGLALVVEGLVVFEFGVSGKPYDPPALLTGGINLGFMFVPKYRLFVVAASLVLCFSVWFVIEKTKLGSLLRAATENPALVRVFGINVPLMLTLTYAASTALAATAGVLAAPVYQFSPQMGSGMIIIVFAVVVIGGMGSILGAILTGYMLGIMEGLTKVFYPEAANTIIFFVMVLVLLVRPQGLFGRTI